MELGQALGTIPSLSGYATESYVGTQISNLVDSSPAALNTLNELASALGDNENFATDTAIAIGNKLPLAGGTITGNLTVNSNLYIGDGNDGYFYNDINGRTAFRSGDFYIQDTVTNFYNYATNQYYGDSSGDNIHFRGNVLNGTNWIINPSDMRTRRYYSSDNTAYYTDPSETSVIKQILINGANNNSGKADFAVGAGGDPQVSWNGNQVQIGGTDMNWNGKIHYGSNIFNMAAWDANIEFFSQGGTTSRNIVFKPSNAGTLTERLTIHGDNGAVIASSQMRAPIFYDSDNTAYYVDPASSNSKLVGLNIHGGANNNTNDATLYVNKTSNADWGIKITGSASATEYGLRVELNGTHSYGAQFLQSGSEYSRIGTDFMQHNAGVRSPKVIAGTSSVALTSNGALAVYDTGNPYISFHTGAARTAYIQELSGRFYFGEVPYTETEGSFRAPLFYDSQNTSYYMDPQNSTFLNQLNVSKLQIDGKQVLDMTNNSTERGPWNPIATSIRNSGRKIYADEDFAEWQ